MTEAQAEVAAYHLNRDEYDQALALYRRIYQFQLEAGASGPSDHTLLMLGVVHRRRGDTEQAIIYLQELLAVANNVMPRVSLLRLPII